MTKPILIPWGGVGAVTGANFELDIPTESGEVKKILVDCGLLQGLPSADAINAEKFDYDPASIEALFITHAHIDHIGKIPKLVKDGFKGVVYSTEETKEIALLMLMDMAKIAASNAQTNGHPAIYEMGDVEKTMNSWQPLKYHAPKDFEGFTVELFNAGHILGSAMYKFTFPSGKSIMFTGDTGSEAAPIEAPMDTVSDLSYLLMDSVYGDRNHQSGPERDEAFKNAITEAEKTGGTILIPSFSLERTQVLLYEINNLFATGAVKPIPVFLDSPLAIKVTEIYERFNNDFNDAAREEAKQKDLFKFPKLMETAHSRDASQIGLAHGAKIIMAGSGMSTAGRILGHEKTYLPDPNATLLFVGYQAPGTMGRLIQEGQKKVLIDNEEVEVKAKIVTVDGFSAHRDSDGLVSFVQETAKSLKQVFVTMGEPKSALFLAQRLHDELGVTAIVPERGKQYELDL